MAIIIKKQKPIVSDPLAKPGVLLDHRGLPTEEAVAFVKALARRRARMDDRLSAQKELPACLA